VADHVRNLRRVGDAAAAAAAAARACESGDEQEEGGVGRLERLLGLDAHMVDEIVGEVAVGAHGSALAHVLDASLPLHRKHNTRSLLQVRGTGRARKGERKGGREGGSEGARRGSEGAREKGP